jgi:plasmid stabilization system protein ParE
VNDKNYSLRFLPTFEDDLNEAVDYICLRLKNPVAAANLVDDVEAAINDRLKCPESFEPYHSIKEHKYPYYCIPVKNYAVFYVVIDTTMEVRRFVYSRRDIRNII